MNLTAIAFDVVSGKKSKSTLYNIVDNEGNVIVQVAVSDVKYTLHDLTVTYDNSAPTNIRQALVELLNGKYKQWQIYAVFDSKLARKVNTIQRITRQTKKILWDKDENKPIISSVAGY